MKYYWYSDGLEKYGPFTKEELDLKRITKSNLVWTEGLSEWILADSLEEINDILVSEPPSLPNANTSKEFENNAIGKEFNSKSASDYDYSYIKETEATVIGVLFLAAVLFIPQIDSFVDSSKRVVVLLCLLVSRFLVSYYVAEIAQKQNRNSTGWAFFAFFLPGIALIIIGQLRKLKLKIELDTNLSTSQQVSILIEKANELSSSERFLESIIVLNKAIELDVRNSEALFLRAMAFYNSNKFASAEKDFLVLTDKGSYLKEVHFYLAHIHVKRYDYYRAIELWELAKECGHDSAKRFIDYYYSFKGTYLLNRSDLEKKIGDITHTDSLTLGQAIGNYINGIAQIDQLIEPNKIKTKIYLRQYGLEINLSKTLKTYYLAISYTEIEDIFIVQEEKLFKIMLYDNNITMFDYSKSRDFQEGLKQICKDFQVQTGLTATASQSII